MDIKTWSTNFLQLEQHPMASDNMHLMMVLIMSEIESEHLGKQSELVSKVADEFAYKVASLRAEAMRLDISDCTKIVIMYLVSGNPGAIVMYLSVLKYQQLQDKQPIDLGRFCELFPTGFPSEPDLSNAWDAQKLADGKNGLDHIDWSTIES
jgi:hypothetical protein